MKPNEVKVGDWAVNVNEWWSTTKDKKYQIIAIEREKFVILDDDGDMLEVSKSSADFRFEPSLAHLNTQTIIIEVPTKIVVTFEKTEIERGEEYLIKTFELADLPQLKREIEHQVNNLANPLSDVVNVKWEK